MKRFDSGTASGGSRTPRDTIAVDVAIAEINIQLGKADLALTQLQPYINQTLINQALKFPDKYATIVLLYVEALVDVNRADDAVNLLEPLLATSKWRQECVFLAVRLPGGKAEKWLDRIAKTIPPDSTPEVIQLAIGYSELGRTTQNPACQQKAISILEPLAANPNCDPHVHAVLGSFYETQPNLAGAEREYRLALASNPNQPIVLNNLASVLLKRKSNLPEALDFVAKAIQLSPKVPNFLDTRAAILASQKRYEEAIASIDEAIKIAPGEPEWQASRIWLLALSGKNDVAVSEYQQFQTTQKVTKLPDELRQRLVEVGFQ